MRSVSRALAGGIVLLLLVGCATAPAHPPGPRGAFFFKTWVGHEPTTDQERKDAEDCSYVVAPRDPTTGQQVAVALFGVVGAAATGLESGGGLSAWKDCIRSRGYTLDEYTLLPSGEWVKR